MWERNMYVVNVDTLSYLGDYDYIPSNIDLIISTADMINDIKYEQIKDTWGSDHHPIKFEINKTASTYRKKMNKTSTKSTSWEEYHKQMEKTWTNLEKITISDENAMNIYEDLTSTMKKCVYLATPGRQHLALRIDRREKKMKDSNINRTNPKKKDPPKEWWDEECKDVTKERIDKLKAFKKNRTMAAYIEYILRNGKK